MTKTKKRIEELDIVKGIAIIYVFMRHVCELVGVNVYGHGFYLLFDRCTESVMFLFVLLSGYVFKSKGSIGLDIKNKCKQLLIPYLEFSAFFTVTYFIRYVLLSDMSLGLFLRNTVSNLIANPNLDIPALGTGYNVMTYAFVPYWYIAEIFMAFLLFIVINRFTEKKSICVKSVTTVGLLGISALLMYLDARDLLENTFASRASYFSVGMNIAGFAGLLLLGTILKQIKIFDIEARSGRFAAILFVVCLVLISAHIVLNQNQYALQYGKWGARDLWSVPITTVTGFSLTYCLIYIARYLKKIPCLKKSLSFLGSTTLDILLLHFGIAELWCMIFGFWYPVYQIDKYPAESFSWWHLVLVTGMTCACIAVYFVIKNQWKKKKLKA